MNVIFNYSEASKLLKSGSTGIIPTDTIYGISCLASLEKNVENIYKIKQRDFDKPFILLINSIEDLQLFGIKISTEEREIIQKYWPGPVSIILDVNDKKFQYLHRGTNTLAFRCPIKPDLQTLLKYTGPIVSTSANISNSAPIANALEAEKIFGNNLDFFLDVGELNNPPSKIIKLHNAVETMIRG